MLFWFWIKMVSEIYFDEIEVLTILDEKNTDIS